MNERWGTIKAHALAYTNRLLMPPSTALCYPSTNLLSLFLRSVLEPSIFTGTKTTKLSFLLEFLPTLFYFYLFVLEHWNSIVLTKSRQVSWFLVSMVRRYYLDLCWSWLAFSFEFSFHWGLKNYFLKYNLLQ